MKRSVEKRLAEVEARQTAQQTRTRDVDVRGEALMDEVHALLGALPEELRTTVEEAGARGVAELVVRYWELGAPTVDLPASALEAYRLAFRGQA